METEAERIIRQAMAQDNQPVGLNVAAPINDPQIAAFMASHIFAEKGNDLDYSHRRCVDDACKLLAYTVVFGFTPDGYMSKYLKEAREDYKRSKGLIS